MAKSPKILILDRDPLLDRRLARVLELGGCEVSHSESLADARRLVDAGWPDLILFDPALAGESVPAEPDSSPAAILALVDSPRLDQALQGKGIPTFDRSGSLGEILATIGEILGVEIVQPARGGRVLLVDDDPEVLALIEHVLSRQGYAVSSVGTGREAVDVVDHGEPPIAAVLLDIILPDQDGLATLRQIVRRNPHPAVVMVSAVADPGIAEQTRKIGAFDYILKPFDPRLVETSVSAAIADFLRRAAQAGKP